MVSGNFINNTNGKLLRNSNVKSKHYLQNTLYIFALLKRLRNMHIHSPDNKKFLLNTLLHNIIIAGIKLVGETGA